MLEFLSYYLATIATFGTLINTYDIIKSNHAVRNKLEDISLRIERIERKLDEQESKSNHKMFGR